MADVKKADIVKKADVKQAGKELSKTLAKFEDHTRLVCTFLVEEGKVTRADTEVYKREPHEFGGFLYNQIDGVPSTVQVAIENLLKMRYSNRAGGVLCLDLESNRLWTRDDWEDDGPVATVTTPDELSVEL